MSSNVKAMSVESIVPGEERQKDTLVLEILQGNLSIEYQIKSRIIRIFTSSTFTDTEAERNALMEKIYPRLRDYCRKAGFEFQVVDMRWGIRDASTDDHSVVDICLKQLKNCKHVSIGPYFVIFLGQKYGYRPLPSQIEAKEFNRFLEITDSNDEDRKLLQDWYRLDNNSVPPIYLLKPITSHYPHYVDSNNKNLQDEARQSWWNTYSQLGTVFRNLSDRINLEQDARRKYFISVTEKEIYHAIFHELDSDHRCLCFKRTISNLDEMVMNRNKYVELYTDIAPATKEIDHKVRTLLNSLRDSRLPRHLSIENVLSYTIEIDQDIKIDHIKHKSYIENFCHDYFKKLTEKIDFAIQHYHKNQQQISSDHLFEEILQHSNFCREKCTTFYGREELLAKIKNYATSDQKELAPFVIYGESGCGKTTLMAKAAYECRNWLNRSAIVVLRFIGTTPVSSSIRTLLRSICMQVDQVYGNSVNSVPEDIQELVDYFTSIVPSRATADKPLVVYLDSLDQLSSEDGALLLGWLPQSCTEHFKLIVSTLPDDQYPCYRKLRSFIVPEQFLHVPTLNNSDAIHVLQNWLTANNRTITSEQKQAMEEAFNKCSLPLYVRLVYHQAAQWHSFTPKDEILLSHSINEIIQNFFEQLERKFGKIFVSRCLAYITAAKNGLSETEIEDLLSCDDEVLDDVFQYWIPPIRRLPPLLWARLRESLGDYLAERGADESRVFVWYHRQFSAAAIKRYLTGPSYYSIHRAMANYFLDLWYDGKSYVKAGSETIFNRRIKAQPLILTDSSSVDQTVYNLRKMSELPYHLIAAKAMDELRDNILFNFQWIFHKIAATSFYNVLDDYTAAATAFPDNKEINLLHNTLRLSSTALLDSPSHLPFQLLGRLKGDSDECKDHLHLQTLLEHANNVMINCMRPSTICLTPPGGALVQTVIGHTRRIKIVTSTNDGKILITADNDKTAKIWNASNLRLLNKITSLGAMLRVIPCGSNQLLAVPCIDKVQIWHMESCKLIVEFPLKWSNSAVVCSHNDCTLVLLDNDEVLMWDMLEEKELKRYNYSSHIQGQRRGLIGSYASSIVLYDWKDDLIAKIVNIDNDQVMQEINNGKFDIENSIVTNNAKLILPFFKNLIKIYCIRTGQYLKDVQGTALGEFTGEKKHLFCLASQQDILTCTHGKVVLWHNNDTNTRTHLLKLQDADVPTCIHFLRRSDDHLSSTLVTAKGNCIYLWECRSIDQTNDDDDDDTLNSSTFSPTRIMPLSSDDNNNYIVCYEKEKRICTVWNAKQCNQPALILKNINVKTFTNSLLFVNNNIAVLGNKVIDLQNGSILCYLKNNLIHSDTLSKFGKVINEARLASLSKDSTHIILLSLRDGSIIKSINILNNGVCHKIIYSENGKIAVTFINNQIIAWNLVDGQEIACCPSPSQLDHVSIDYQGRCLAVFSYSVLLNKDDTAKPVVYLWRLENRQRSTYQIDYNPRAGGLAITNQFIICGNALGVISLWDTCSGNLVERLIGHTGDIYRVIINQEENRMLSMSEYDYDGIIRLWDLTLLTQLAAFRLDWRVERSNVALIDHGEKVMLYLEGLQELLIVNYHTTTIDQNQISTDFDDLNMTEVPLTIDTSAINTQSIKYSSKENRKQNKTITRICTLL